MTSTTAGMSEIRKLGATDLCLVERHLLELPFAARRARFHSPLSGTAITAYVRRIEPARIVLVGAIEAATGRLVGLAEAHPTETPWTVEMAISVHELYQQQGLGGRLLSRALELAFEAGADIAQFVFAPDNRALMRLVRHLGGRIDALRGQAWIYRCTGSRTTAAA
jgi:GNAT superfamily N-acetyltransferase